MSEANGCAELIFEFCSNGKASGTTVTARLGDDVLHVDRFDVAKAGPRDKFLDSICKGRPGIKRADVERVLLARAAVHAARQAKADDKPADTTAADLLTRMPEHVRAEARAMLEAPDLLGRCYRDVHDLGVAGEGDLVAAIYLIGVSRLLPRPLAAIVQAPSSVGKSYVVEKVASLFPPEAVIHATSLTPQALFYMDPGSLSHRWIVAGERSRREDDESAEATRALREMIGSGRLTKLIPMKIEGRMVTQTIDQPGPIAYIETTTLSKIFDEDVNRCLLLAADERTSQTEAVLDRLADGYCGATTPNVEAIVQRHWAAQRMLQQRPVHVPFAKKIVRHFPKERVEARRAYPHFVAMIQACALLHQYQRTIDADGRIVATGDDYQMARHLCRGPLARLLGGRVSDAAIRFHDRLTGWAAAKFTTTEAAKADRKASQTVRDWLRELAEVNAVEQLESAKGNRPATWRLTAMEHEELAAGNCDLPERIE